MAGNELKAVIIVDGSGAQQTFELVGNSAVKAAAKIKSIVPSSNTAGFALQNVGRIAQDASFGFIGIQNNINPLLESFQRLRAESASNSEAMKKLVGSLMGAGGLGLAISVISSAILFMTNGFDRWTHGMGGSKTAIDENKLALERLDDELAITKKALEGVIASIEFLNQLGKIDIDVNFAPGTATDVLKLHQEVGGLREEAFKLEKAWHDLNKQQTDLFAANIVAPVPGFQDKMDKLGKAAEDAKAKWVEAENKLSILYRQTALVRKTSERDAQKEIDDERAAALKREIAEAERQAKKLLEIRAKFFEEVERQARQKVALFSTADMQEELNQTNFKVPDIAKKITKSPFMDNLGGSIEKAEKDRLKRQKDYNDELNRTATLLTGAVTPAFDQMFDAILAGENPMKAFFKGLIQGITDLIKQLIVAAIKALILKAITSSSPVGALAGFIPGVGMGLGGRANNTGNLFGGNRVAPLHITISSRIEGNHIVQSVDRTLRSQRRTGG